MVNRAGWCHSAALDELEPIFLNGAQRSVNRKVQGSNPCSGAKTHASTNMLCLRRPTIYMLSSVSCYASHSRQLTASFDSFAGTPTRRLALIQRGGWFESIAPAKEANLPGTVGALCNLRWDLPARP